ncbi:hypothetical protein EV144_1011019 [Flavobacterium sp. 270]|uniref:DUF6452 family protein n=1 Tax=Flavobacterium sp. 270 TaxID=2512114 RepID=UPI001065F3C6|nr:DUF6452 family protein [Flavobacterium sp. 270]TDW52330.1 hypothetical protein EV144_1011019 [Flavobacterium sp. 270]
MKKIISFFLVLTFGLSSCEKDDICDAGTPTTPRLVISFLNSASPTLPKNVQNLKVIGEGQPEGIIFNTSAVDNTKYLANGSKILIPLKTDDTGTVTYSFIYNFGNTTGTNTDVLTFNYKTKQVYVSRACGFKTTFELLPEATLPLPGTHPFVVEPDPDGIIWMKQINVITPNIETENETHIEILF